MTPRVVWVVERRRKRPGQRWHEMDPYLTESAADVWRDYWAEQAPGYAYRVVPYEPKERP